MDIKNLRCGFENLDDAVACIENRVLCYKKAHELFQRIKQEVQNGVTTWEKLRTSEAYLLENLEMVNPKNGFIVPPPFSML
jgi:hypothetical protein